MTLVLEATFVLSSLAAAHMPRSNYRISDAPATGCQSLSRNCFAGTINMIDAIQMDLESLPAVARAVVEQEGESLRAEVFLSRFDRDSRYSVYGKVSAIYDGFPALDFSFKVIDASAHHALAS